jgi:DNA-binding IclR family transcriptional regulator
MGDLAHPLTGSQFRPLLRELADTVGALVFLARREGASLVVTDAIGDPSASRIESGLRMPLVAPFGRDYVAWASNKAVRAWLKGIGAPSTQLRRRLTAVLAEVRDRGYVIERLSREYVRVYMALRALATDDEPDPIAARLAGAFADLTLVDYLRDELDGDTVHHIATISAPIKDAEGAVTMSITAAPFGSMTSDEIWAAGSVVSDIARRISQQMG